MQRFCHIIISSLWLLPTHLYADNPVCPPTGSAALQMAGDAQVSLTIGLMKGIQDPDEKKRESSVFALKTISPDAFAGLSSAQSEKIMNELEPILLDKKISWFYRTPLLRLIPLLAKKLPVETNLKTAEVLVPLADVGELDLDLFAQSFVNLEKLLPADRLVKINDALINILVPDRHWNYDSRVKLIARLGKLDIPFSAKQYSILSSKFLKLIQSPDAVDETVQALRFYIKHFSKNEIQPLLAASLVNIAGNKNWELFRRESALRSLEVFAPEMTPDQLSQVKDLLLVWLQGSKNLDVGDVFDDQISENELIVECLSVFSKAFSSEQLMDLKEKLLVFADTTTNSVSNRVVAYRWFIENPSKDEKYSESKMLSKFKFFRDSLQTYRDKVSFAVEIANQPIEQKIFQPYEDAIKSSKKEESQKALQELMHLTMLSAFPDAYLDDPWAKAQAQDLAVRRSALPADLSDFKKELSDWQPLKTTKAEVVPEPTNLHEDDFELMQMRAGAMAACSAYGVFDANECAKALLRITVITGFHMNGRAWMVKQFYKKVLVDPVMEEGIRKASLKILGFLEDKKGGDAASNLFKDLVDSFKASGAKDKEADSYAYETLAFLASDGPNTADRLREADNPPAHLKLIADALQVLGSAPEVLDSVRNSQNLPFYSYPPEVKTKLDSGKTYHFWMSAYLTHRLIDEGFSEAAAKKAPWIAEQAYQTFTKFALRTPESVFTQPVYSSYNNRIRMDLAFTSAGIDWAAWHSSQKGKFDLDIDTRLRSIFLASSNPLQLSKDDAKKLIDENKLSFGLKWRELFAPDAGSPLKGTTP